MAGRSWWRAAWSSPAASAWGEEHLPQLTRLARLLDEERACGLSPRRLVVVAQLEHRLGLSLSGLARLRRDAVLAEQAAADAGDDDGAECEALVAEVGEQMAACVWAGREAYRPEAMARWQRALRG